MIELLTSFLGSFQDYLGTIVSLMVFAGLFAGRKTFVRYIALAVDIFWNVFTGGMVGMTISARSEIAKSKGKKWGILMVKFLDIFEKDHCKKAVQGDIDRAKAVLEALTPYDDRVH